MEAKTAALLNLITKTIREKFRVLVDREVLEVYGGDEKFSEFLTEFLSGKPFWLKEERWINPVIELRSGTS